MSVSRVSASLGVLDNLDDYGAAPKTAPQSPLPQTRAARSGSWEEELDLVVPKQQVDLDTQHKLEQLDSLLSDDKLRAALENLRRAGG